MPVVPTSISAKVVSAVHALVVAAFDSLELDTAHVVLGGTDEPPAYPYAAVFPANGSTGTKTLGSGNVDRSIAVQVNLWYANPAELDGNAWVDAWNFFGGVMDAMDALIAADIKANGRPKSYPSIKDVTEELSPEPFDKAERDQDGNIDNRGWTAAYVLRVNATGVRSG